MAIDAPSPRAGVEALASAMRAGDVDASERQFDAIVVGAGAAGGLAAELLCEAGLDVLLLDAGKPVTFREAPFRYALGAAQRTLAHPRMLAFIPNRVVRAGRAGLRLLGRTRQPIQTQCYAWERAADMFVDDRDHSYTTADGHPFAWIRRLGLGGRMVVPGHGRQYYRFGPEEFASHGAPPWPFAANELEPWYALVEKRLRLTGNRDGLIAAPDSEIANEQRLMPWELSLAQAIRARWQGADVMASRYAPPRDSVTVAALTGRLSCKSGAMAQRVLLDRAHRASGVEWCDYAGGRHSSKAPLVFVCASTLESTRILLNTELPRAAGDSALGRYLMDHVMVKAEAQAPRVEQPPAGHEDGRCLYLPRFDRRDGRGGTFGYGVQLYRTHSYLTAVAFGESAPRAENRVALAPDRKDRWGNPTLRIEHSFGQEERRSASVMARSLRELAEIAGAQVHTLEETPATPGLSVHECGTARMGGDPATSVLDPNNCVWNTTGLFVTDGAAFPSQGAQNPTLTIMALTARACDHAVRMSGRR